MVTGWVKVSKGKRRYFNPRTGYMQTKWLTLNNNKYYFFAREIPDISTSPAVLWLLDGSVRQQVL